ncbi:glycosyl hydrolase family 43 protein [Plectosphaerella plurivora]|uniref:Glycosyl hydrolase family 43 protein n=1 Tax=Plectosphaerella plurivora TaxID=936078 RepID=A0A9P8V240_9PEZI|nr:glycosyl hydrolase family 43 protein [Plectosphaerella plurivora]
MALRRFSSLILGASLWSTIAHATLDVIPGASWTATNTGEHVQAHGHGIIQVDGIYYMIGEDKTTGTFFQNVNCYSSRDLVEWTYEGALLSRTTEAGDLGPNRIVERPKVIFNEATNKYVLYMHIDSSDYRDARVGVASGDSVCGTYEYHGSFRPLGFQSRDIGLFQDEDGSAYLLTEDREYGTRIIALTDDYLGVTEVTFGWQYFAESPALIKHKGYYFIFGSHLTGWNPNDNVYSYATSLSGPWSEWTEFAPIGSNTHSSQVSYILPLGTDNAIYIGDRWISSNLAASTYIWLPLNITGTKVQLDWYESWAPDVASGTWSTRGASNALEGEAAQLSSGAVVISCTDCAGGQAAGYLGGGPGGKVVFDNVLSASAGRDTITIKYRNHDVAPRHARVTVNDVGYDLAFISNRHRSDRTASAPLHCELKEGRNVISFETEGGEWGPDVDQLLVPRG